ncbi:Phosphatidate cytidylyltransferase [Fundidesulfovibrio magnetotacticus]|uniref:Phosphatidate cytidylyltransferase n=1 Tax=Fundidesulfovibrio magnetotacticus TaxID=2730080 RepID=A0A6V8LJI4_9BACT|nr:phosphatidate cytidylyltransferase [Fundidesulfovibrio magnetotacticus]GFK92883.1 Phosphatidate cytidylyltransferase [Fundidesulfovibrio magnetotacticus]
MLGASHRTRWITSAVALPLLAGCIWAGGGWMFALALAASLAGLWEFAGLFPGTGFAARAASLALGALMLWLARRHGPGAALAVPLAVFWLEEFARLFGLFKGAPRWFLPAALLYVPGSLLFLPGFGPGETALVIAAVMACDTGAYYAGSLIGGPKIWPSISPRKTWAGSAGGLAACMAVCAAAGALWGAAPAGVYALLGAALAVASQMGDFMESAMKRAAGVKDSGNLLPGHGGLLDRVDGLIPAILVYALARNLTQLP